MKDIYLTNLIRKMKLNENCPLANLEITHHIDQLCVFRIVSCSCVAIMFNNNKSIDYFSFAFDEMIEFDQ
ncbi:hypothetical protein DERF_005208 [Dermatophagoides farinae]|uniref:Uncharacterized protein n=1 Tax=Dermatophagoides farinae TaxID=6954 RepID=A0A922I7Q9_DERFA|nr:hypothetical protein DERF_005208 [Dermatophagoides farinae]